MNDLVGLTLVIWALAAITVAFVAMILGGRK